MTHTHDRLLPTRIRMRPSSNRPSKDNLLTINNHSRGTLLITGQVCSLNEKVSPQPNVAIGNVPQQQSPLTPAQLYAAQQASIVGIPSSASMSNDVHRSHSPAVADSRLQQGYQQQSHSQQQYQPARMPSPAPPQQHSTPQPATGHYTDSGRAVLFFGELTFSLRNNFNQTLQFEQCTIMKRRSQRNFLFKLTILLPCLQQTPTVGGMG